MKKFEIIIFILVLAVGYLFAQNINLRKSVESNRDTIDAHQYSIDLIGQQVRDLHGITLEIIKKAGLNVNNSVATDPYEG